MGWFYGFKLHLIVNHEGEILAFALTAGNVDDRTSVSQLIQHVFGKLFGDKGYLSQPLRDDLRDIGIELVTSLRRNMKPQLMPLYDKLLLKRRSDMAQAAIIDHNPLLLDLEPDTEYVFRMQGIGEDCVIYISEL